MSLDRIKSTIATRLQSERLHDAYDLARSVGLYDLAKDIAELIYSRGRDYQGLRQSIIDGLKSNA